MDTTTILSVLTGIGLAAACGFRVFVPLLALGLAGRAHLLPLNESFAVLSTLPTLIALGTAALVEVAAYYVPWLDNALDVAAVARPDCCMVRRRCSGSRARRLPAVRPIRCCPPANWWELL